MHTGSGIVGYTPGEFAVNTTSFSNNTNGGAFSVVQQGNDLVLLFTPVPEPGTWALLGVGAGSLLFVIRRRTRRMAA